MENGSTKHSKWNDERLGRLSKRLIYILRYGAVKEGLTVSDKGYVLLEELERLPLMSDYSRDELLHEIDTSRSHRTTPRYERRMRNGGAIEVRATYMRRFEVNPVHPGTKVKTLSETAMTFVLNNLDDYDFETFPDEETIRRMFRRLKRQKRLTVKALQALLVPALTRVDLEGVLLTDKVLTALSTQCPAMAEISFKGCGYAITDHRLGRVVRALPCLQKLNLCQCNHLTSGCLNILAKHCPRLTSLRAPGVASLTFQPVKNLLLRASALTFLDIYYMVYSAEEYREIMALADSRGVTLILKEPREITRQRRQPDDASDDENHSSTEPEDATESPEGTSDDEERGDSASESDLEPWNQWKDYIYEEDVYANNVSGSGANCATD